MSPFVSRVEFGMTLASSFTQPWTTSNMLYPKGIFDIKLHNSSFVGTMVSFAHWNSLFTLFVHMAKTCTALIEIARFASCQSIPRSIASSLLWSRSDSMMSWPSFRIQVWWVSPSLHICATRDTLKLLCNLSVMHALDLTYLWSAEIFWLLQKLQKRWTWKIAGLNSPRRRWYKGTRRSVCVSVYSLQLLPVVGWDGISAGAWFWTIVLFVCNHWQFWKIEKDDENRWTSRRFPVSFPKRSFRRQRWGTGGYTKRRWTM